MMQVSTVLTWANLRISSTVDMNSPPVLCFWRSFWDSLNFVSSAFKNHVGSDESREILTSIMIMTRISIKPFPKDSSLDIQRENSPRTEPCEQCGWNQSYPTTLKKRRCEDELKMGKKKKIVALHLLSRCLCTCPHRDVRRYVLHFIQKHLLPFSSHAPWTICQVSVNISERVLCGFYAK